MLTRGNGSFVVCGPDCDMPWVLHCCAHTDTTRTHENSSFFLSNLSFTFIHFSSLQLDRACVPIPNCSSLRVKEWSYEGAKTIFRCTNPYFILTAGSRSAVRNFLVT